ncbi:MAG: flagellar basal body-associated FliL family protein [Bdellovibrionales bacterium]|jgi:flagellar basal body-associated protein FliL|nr:flagellar basal body-associated FliL family protein [Bdellovibrionales bacterium]
MAENTDSRTEGLGGKDEGIIDLAGIVRGIDVEPTEASADASAGDSGDTSGDAAAGGEDVGAQAFQPEELPFDRLDLILGEEDPEMLAHVEAISKLTPEPPDGEEPDLSSFASGLDSDLSHEEKAKVTKVSPFREYVRFQLLKAVGVTRALKALAGRAAKDTKGVVREIAITSKVRLITWYHDRKSRAKKTKGWIGGLERKQKVLLLTAFVGLSIGGFVLFKTIQGSLLPKSQQLWIANLADKADRVFKYDPKGSFEDFNDPILHPEFIIVLERVIVNLTRTTRETNGPVPMAAFEVYLQTDNRESAVELKDRNVEVRDLVARTSEHMTYPELVEEAGKERLKLLIRKELNGLLTKGRVRRVYFKTIVLNPE